MLSIMNKKSTIRCFRDRACLIILLLDLLFAPVTAVAQSLFESATRQTDGQEAAPYQVNGYFRSGIFASDQEFRATYAEGAAKLEMFSKRGGKAFAEVRYRASSADDENDAFTLREGYVSLSAEKFDLRIGQQIIVWGRADGFNPTNNLTPTDFTTFSPDEDDKRLANVVAKGVYYAHPVNIEFDWVPIFRSSELPFENAALPDGVEWSDDGKLDSEWKHSSFGLKIDLEQPSVDGSLSYFRGYHKLPGIRFSVADNLTGVYTEPYRVQVWGADFSTTAGSYGFRGEFAYSRPDEKTNRLYSVPCQQIEYTFGIDREWNNLSLIMQYIGKHVLEFDADAASEEALSDALIQWNQMILGQQEAWNHSVSLRPSMSLWHDTMSAELLGLVNFSTEEVFLQPKVTYDIADALVFSIGAQLFYGPDDTLYGYMEEKKNACFVELKKSF